MSKINQRLVKGDFKDFAMRGDGRRIVRIIKGVGIVIVAVVGFAVGYLMMIGAYSALGFFYHGVPMSIALSGPYDNYANAGLIISVMLLPLLTASTIVAFVLRKITPFYGISFLLIIFMLQIVDIGVLSKMALMSRSIVNERNADWQEIQGSNISSKKLRNSQNSTVGKVNFSHLPNPSCGESVEKVKKLTGGMVINKGGELYWINGVGSGSEERITKVSNVGKFRQGGNGTKIYWIGQRTVNYTNKNGYNGEYEAGVVICEGDLETGETKVLLDLALDEEKWKQEILDNKMRYYLSDFDVKNDKLAIVNDGVWLRDLEAEGLGLKIGVNVPMSDNNVGDIKSYDGVRFSPDGSKLLMLASGWEWALADLYDLKGETIRKITNFDGGLHQGRWSADGSKLYWWTNSRMGSPGVGEIDVLSGKVKRWEVFDFGKGAYDIGWVAWSDSGKTATVLGLFGVEAFPKRENLDLGKLVRVEPTLYLLEGEQFTPIRQMEGGVYHLAWSPNEAWLAYLDKETLKVLNLKGEVIQEVSGVEEYQWVR